jgi:hypothetical protein
MSAEPNQNREAILQAAMEELSALRQETMPLPDQSQTASVIEAIDFYERILGGYTNLAVLLEQCGRAIADVTHEVAAAKFGWESPEAEAIFEEQDRELTKLIRWIAKQTSARKVA